MVYDSVLHWAWYESWAGNKKEALQMLVDLTKEYEIVEEMENRKQKKETGVG